MNFLSWIFRELTRMACNQKTSNNVKVKLSLAKLLSHQYTLLLLQDLTVSFTLRLKLERAENRVFYSSYTRDVLELAIAIRCALDRAEQIHPTELNDPIHTEMIPMQPQAPIIESITMNSAVLTWSRPFQLDKSKMMQKDLETSQRDLTCKSFNTCCASACVTFILECRKTPLHVNEESKINENEEFKVIYRGSNTTFTISQLDVSFVYNIRLRTEWNSCLSDPSAVVDVCASRSHTFSFDANFCGPNIRISNSALSVTYMSNENWSTALGSNGFAYGVNYWEVQIDSACTSYIFIGVARREVNLSSFLGGDEHGWGYIGDRAVYHRRVKSKVYGEPFATGDVIGVTLDMNKGTLSFSRNGIDLGIAFEGLSGVLYPAVSFYNRDQRITLCKDSFQCPGISISNGVSSVTIDGLYHFFRFLESFNAYQGIPEEFLKLALDDWKMWERGKLRRCVTRCGAELDFDVTDEVCEPLGFLSGDRVQTLGGSAVVLGVHGEKLWFLLDGQEGATFFSTSTVEKEAGLEGKERENSNSSGFILLEKRDANKYVNENTQSDSYLDSVFYACTQPSPFLIRDMAILARDVSLACEKRGWSPMALSQSQLSSLLSELSRQVKIASGVYVSLAEESNQRVLVDPQIVIRARLSLLKLLNKHASVAIPFSDLRCCFAEVDLQWECGGPIDNQPCWMFLDAEADCSLQPKSWSSALSQTNSTFPRRWGGLSIAIAHIRGLLFYQTKLKVLHQVLQHTITKPKRAEDDYDYPEELPQISLNRHKASLALDRPATTMRLSNSLIGQAFEELHFLSPTVLRISYSHPMDDGQERCFKVKFDGEGVDDYGGPYRECFTQLFDELQMLSADRFSVEPSLTKQNEQTLHKNEESTCVLPLFIPSTNSQTRTGNGQEKLVLSPSLLREPGVPKQLYLEMYHFVGQLIGIALRSRISVQLRWPAMLWKILIASPLTLSDLEEVDVGTCNILRSLLSISIDGADDGYLQALLNELQWEAHLSDGSLVEMIPNGSGKGVTAADKLKYVQSVMRCRARESEEAKRSLLSGFISIIPCCILPLFTWQEMEYLVCGNESLDVDLLQQFTDYDDDISPDDQHIQFFWSALRKFSSQDKALFLKFVWARSRLPTNASGFRQRFKIQSPAIDHDVHTLSGNASNLHANASVMNETNALNVSTVVASTANDNVNENGTDANRSLSVIINSNEDTADMTNENIDGLENAGQEDNESRGQYIDTPHRIVVGSGAEAHKSSCETDVNKQLPKAHTCFFSLTLPRYTSEEALSDRLLYAIHNCQEMDADFRLTDAEMTGWIQDH